MPEKENSLREKVTSGVKPPNELQLSEKLKHLETKFFTGINKTVVFVVFEAAYYIAS